MPTALPSTSAFIATCPKDDRNSRAEAHCDVNLPWLVCPQCEKDWRILNRVPPINPSPWVEPEVWYPALSYFENSDIPSFTQESRVSLVELNFLRRKISGPGAHQAWLPPGSGIGKVKAKLPNRGTDFVWCAFKLLASRKAVSALENAGLKIQYGPVVPIGRSVAEYLALQLDPVQIYSDQTLQEMTMAFCSECGQCWMRDVRAKPKGPRQYVRSAAPSNQGLIRAMEGIETLATDQFMKVVLSEKLTGVEFQEFGVWV